MLQIEMCEKRDGLAAHCDHQTGQTHEGHRLTARRWTCCFCARVFDEEVKPLPAFGTLTYRASDHGPHAPPPARLMNVNASVTPALLHACGLQGFGRRASDVCPACSAPSTTATAEPLVYGEFFEACRAATASVDPLSSPPGDTPE